MRAGAVLDPVPTAIPDPRHVVRSLETAEADLRSPLTLVLRWLLVLSVVAVSLAVGNPVKAEFILFVTLILPLLWVPKLLLHRSGIPRLLVAGAAFLAVLTLSSAFAISRHIAIWGSVYRHEGLVAWLGYVLVALVAAHEFRHTRLFQRRLMVAFFVGAGVNAAYAMLQFRGHDPVWGYATYLRPFGLAANPVFLGGYLAMSLPLAVAIAVRAPAGAASLSGFALSILLYAAILVSGSRSAWAASWLALLGFSLTAGLLRRPPNRTRLAVLALSTVVLTILFLTDAPPFARKIDRTILERIARDSGLPMPERFNLDDLRAAARLRGTFSESGGIPQRVILWSVALERWWRRPLWGHGLDSFRYIPDLRNPTLARIYGGEAPGRQGFYFDRTHNQLLEVAVCTGIFGLAGYLVWTAALLVPGWKAALASRSHDSLAAGSGAMAFLLVLMVEPSYLGTFFIFWIFLGFFYALSVGEERPQALWERPRRTPPASIPPPGSRQRFKGDLSTAGESPASR